MPDQPGSKWDSTPAAGPKISVIICSRNPRRDFLERALDALRKQSLSKTKWELLLIDNASSELLASTWDLLWHPRARHVREEVLGLTPARLRGIGEARGEILIFVDDDNVLAPDFLERAERIATAYPHLGTFGAGVLRPEYECAPAARLKPFLSFLAVREVPRALWTNNPRDFATIPWGAGLCVTSFIAKHYRDLILRLNMSDVLDRRGDELWSGGDDLFSWAAVDAGRSFGIFPELRAVHLIAAQRVQPAYVVPLIRAHAYSHTILRFLLFAERQPARKGTDLFRDLAHGLRRGRFSLRCRRAASFGSLAAERTIAAKDLRPLKEGGLGWPQGPAAPAESLDQPKVADEARERSVKSVVRNL